MCRLAAYLGPKIALERIITKPKHSLLCQSRQAEEAKLEVNGDGFGVAWYNDFSKKPGLFRDLYPAWADENLLSLCQTAHSTLFLAHVRAATFGGTSRTNCHPFCVDNFSFMHNGQLAGLAQITRPLEALLSDELFALRKGKTDSELLFLLMCHFGLADDPYQASLKAFKVVEAEQERQGVVLDRQNFNHAVCVFSNGSSLYGIRYSSDERSPTLYFHPSTEHKGRCLASEPIDGIAEGWQLIEENSFLKIDESGLEHKDFML